MEDFNFDKNMNIVSAFDFNKNIFIKINSNSNNKSDIDIVRDFDFVKNIYSNIINDFGDLINVIKK